jgi:Beta/Gamma crystallin
MPYSRFFVIVVFLALTTLTYADDSAREVQVTDKNCWVEIFEDNNFDQDDPHVKLMGTQEYATLTNVFGRDWNNDVESVLVGPNANVKAYSKKDFKGTEVAFTPNQRVPDLSKLDMGNDIESMKVTCGRS